MKEERQRIGVNKSKYFVHLIHDIENKIHKDWVRMDLYLQVLRKYFQFQNLLNGLK